MDPIRIIKKYPNRRLYDSTSSRYVTLDDIQELVLNHIPFKVIHTDTDEDVTNPILLQIISEMENGTTPLFTTAILKNIILYYGNPMQKKMRDFLDQLFSSAQQVPGSGETKNDPFNSVMEVTKQSMKLWQDAFAQYFSNSPEDLRPSTPQKKKRKPGA